MRIALASIIPFQCHSCLRDESRRTVRAYAKQMQAGVGFPPIQVIRHAPHVYEIADGMHRTRAARMVGRKMIEAVIIVG